MSVINDLLKQRGLPELLEFADGAAVTSGSFPDRRAEMLAILENEIYGHAPAAPKVRASVTEASQKYGSFAGKATVDKVSISFDTERGEFSFPCVQVVPKSDKRLPVFVLINFRPDVPDRYYPAEELVDEGFAVVSLCYNDITADKDDESGLATMYSRDKYDWGKLRMWAFAMSRVIDYLQTTDYADMSRIATVGHSRLGKTSLICAAFDERVALACANDSGCAGDAITRDKRGERIRFITETFPYWFCPKYNEYTDRENFLPFDQHFLLACIAPRKLSLGAAVEDIWADPDSQYLSACAASPAWELLGYKGFVHPDRLPAAEECFDEGSIRFHLRNGSHYFSRTDWLVYINSLNNC